MRTTTITSLLLIAMANPSFAVTPKDFGASGNVVTLLTCGITSGATTLTCSGAAFVSGDVGKAIVVSLAGATGIPGTRNNALVTTIAGFTNATTVTLGASASNTVSNALTYYGTDDTAAIRSCVNAGTLIGGRCTINDGVTFMVSNTASTINISGTSFRPGGILDGTGTIIFAPKGTLTGGTNDRFLYLISTEATPLKIIIPTGTPIAKGATTFTCAPADCATLSPGDWVIITEKDAGATDNVYVDWVQVSTVSGTTVTVINPFRMTFPNLRPFSTSGAPCVVASPCGLSFRKVTNIVSNVTVRDFSLIVPKISNSQACGIGTRDTRGVTVTNLNINAESTPFFSYLDQGLIHTNNRENYQEKPAEFASQVDAVITGNVWNQPGSSLLGITSTPGGAGPELDFGTGFSTFSHNIVGPVSNAGVETFYGLHDTALTDNTFGWVYSGGGCITLQGAYRNQLSGNICTGGSPAFGMYAADTGGLTVDIKSDGNVIWNNTVNGFSLEAYKCIGSLGTDNCFDPTQTGLALKTVDRATLLGITPQNGTLLYCSGCAIGTTCAAGTGAVAKRINGVWACN